MTQTETLKLALEALKMCRALIRINIERLVPIESPNPWFSRDVDYAITAIREALTEQPAQQQEPVATVTSESGNPDVSMSWWHEPALPVGTKLYTSPPASKPWVSLTDEEMHACWDSPLTPLGMKHARLIEAKLKEKNT